jgi:hypothetical protein
MEDSKLIEVLVLWYCWNSGPYERGKMALEKKNNKVQLKVIICHLIVTFWRVEHAYSKLKFPNLEKSTDASVSDILLFLNTLQDGTINV